MNHGYNFRYGKNMNGSVFSFHLVYEWGGVPALQPHVRTQYHGKLPPWCEVDCSFTVPGIALGNIQPFSLILDCWSVSYVHIDVFILLHKMFKFKETHCIRLMPLSVRMYTPVRFVESITLFD